MRHCACCVMRCYLLVQVLHITTFPTDSTSATISEETAQFVSINRFNFGAGKHLISFAASEVELFGTRKRLLTPFQYLWVSISERCRVLKGFFVLYCLPSNQTSRFFVRDTPIEAIHTCNFSLLDVIWICKGPSYIPFEPDLWFRSTGYFLARYAALEVDFSIFRNAFIHVKEAAILGT